MVSVEHLTMEFGAKPVLDDISFLINRKDRIALVGKNGAGKTTLLRLLAGEYTPTAGTIAIEAGTQIGYLPQVMLLKDDKTLREEVYSGDDPRMIAEMDRTITGLGFRRTDFDRACSEFSGGWRMRIELAKILLAHPDLLLLDEPTNHLDIESIEWLEDFIHRSAMTLVLVSHDRAFINRVTTRTIEITLGRIYDYNVPYNQFVTLRQERHEQQVRAYENQQKMIADTEAFIERFRYKPTKAVQVQSRIKQLAKLERVEVDLEDTSKLNLRFPPAERSGDYPVIIEELTKAYGNAAPVLRNVNLTIRRGEKVAFIGKNGEGKTTLVRCIMGQLDYLGSLKIGHGVKIGYFAQNQAALLDEERTVYDTIDHVAVGDIRTKIRDILGAFMFGGEASDKRVKVLSGGERSRLAMIQFLLQPGNLLIMDEPTNHLDMPSKDVLKQALQNFNGTVILVSHDRDFLDGLVDKIYVFGNQQVREHFGSVYDPLDSVCATGALQEHYKSTTRALQEHYKSTTRALQDHTDTSSNAKADYEAQKAAAAAARKKQKLITETEARIAALEQEQKDLEAALAATFTDQLAQRYEHIKHEIEKKYYEWEILCND